MCEELDVLRSSLRLSVDNGFIYEAEIDRLRGVVEAAEIINWMWDDLLFPTENQLMELRAAFERMKPPDSSSGPAAPTAG